MTIPTELEGIIREPIIDPVPATLLYRPLITVDQRELIIEALETQQLRFQQIITKLPLDDSEREIFREDIRTLRRIVSILGHTPAWEGEPNAHDDK